MFELIRDVEIMKAETGMNIVKKWFDDGEEVYAEVKYDGIRAFAEMEGSKLQSIRTYNMSEFDTSKLAFISKQLSDLGAVWTDLFMTTPHFFIDFELTGKERQSVSGEVNKLLKGTAKEGCDENWKVN